MTNFCGLDDTTSKPATGVAAVAAAAADKAKNKPAKIYQPHGLGFRLSYQCLIGCRHCYQKSEPGRDVFFDKDRLLDVLKEGRDAGLNNVGFSGGEPFLRSDMVFEGIKVARDYGFKGAIGVVTNGFWGKTAKSAETVIGKMADAGFSPPNGRMNISVGEFHQEWIAVSTIANVVAAHWERFRQPVNFLVTFSKGNGGVFQKLRDHLKKNGLPEEAYLHQIYSSVAHVGRAGEVIAADVNPEVPVEKYDKCVGINRFSIEPNGKVAPCCGFNRFINGLFMGNLYENSVSEIIDRTNRSIVFQYLKRKPLRDIHAILARKFEMKKGYRHKCELCEALFNKPEHIVYLEEVAEAELGKLLQPDSLAEGTKFFREREPAPVKVLPSQAKPVEVKSEKADAKEPAPFAAASGIDLEQLRRRIEKLEAENVSLRQEMEKLAPAKRLAKATVRIRAGS